MHPIDKSKHLSISFLAHGLIVIEAIMEGQLRVPLIFGGRRKDVIRIQTAVFI